MIVKSYLGNANLKAINVQLPFTKNQVDEYLRCSTDLVYFIETYCKIVILDHGLQPFKLYECQKKKIKIIHENRKVILMEGRQQGKTTTSAAYILWYTLFQESKTVAILANKATAAREVLYRYQLMYENLPLWLQQGVSTWNKGDIALENGSIVFTAATNRAGIRGKSCVTSDTKVCIEENENVFYVEIDKVINNSNFINIDNTMKKYIIYKTINLQNGKIYVGFHSIEENKIIRTDFGHLSCFSDGYLGSGKMIISAIEKYGPENFAQEILGVFDTKEEAEFLERKIVNEEFISQNDVYNIVTGGNVTILCGEKNGFYGKKHDQKTIDKIRESREKTNLPTYQCTVKDKKTEKQFFGYKQALDYYGYEDSEFNNANKKRFFLGKLVSDDIIEISNKEFEQAVLQSYKKYVSVNSQDAALLRKKNLSESASQKFLGKKQSEAQKIKKSKSMKKWISENKEAHEERLKKINSNPEKIKKTAEKHTGMKRSDQTRKNISDSLRGKPSPNKGKRLIVNNTTQEKIFISVKNLIPEGWSIATLGGKKNLGKKSYTNGEKYKMFVPGEEPIGWIKCGASKKKKTE